MKAQIKITLLFFTAVLLRILPGTADAETYKWVDETGKTHFSSSPPKGVKKNRNVSQKRRERKKLYDLRGKVVEILTIDRVRLKSGKVVKYIGVTDPSDFLLKNGMSEKIEEAVRFHEKLVKGKVVTVLLGETPTDRHGDYLGHVFIGQESFVNADLIRKGYALTEEFPSDFEYQSLFVRLYKEAQKKRLGIWGR